MTSTNRPTLADAARAFEEAMYRCDVDRIAACFGEDGYAWYPGAERPTVGRAENREAWARYFDRLPTHPLSTDEVVAAAAGDLGYSSGRWAIAEAPGPGVVAGRYLAVWRQSERGWEIAMLSAHVHTDVQPFAFAPEIVDGERRS